MAYRLAVYGFTAWGKIGGKAVGVCVVCRRFLRRWGGGKTKLRLAGGVSDMG